MMNFWGIIYDDDKKTMEVIGTFTNDTLLTNNVWEMQQTGMKVRCQTADISIPKENLILAGYNLEDDLYSRLLREYEQRVHKQLKQL